MSLRKYYIRRVTRIEPPYVIHLFFLFLICTLFLHRFPTQWHLNDNPDWFGFCVRHILASLCYLNELFFGGVRPFPNIVLWSLEVEVQFYLLAPILALIFLISNPRLRRALILTLILGLPFAVDWICPNRWLADATLLGSLRFFLTGFLLVDFYLLKELESMRQRAWDLVFPVVIAAITLLRSAPVLHHLLPWLLLLLCLSAFCGTLSSKVLSWPWLTTIGGMCYTIYMYHWLMISGIVRVTGHLRTHILWLDLLMQFLLMSVIITVVCSVLFTLFERPFMQRDWPQKLRAWVTRGKAEIGKAKS